MSNFWTFTSFEGIGRSKCEELSVFYASLVNNELIAGGKGRMPGNYADTPD
jgi:hypothetical protein